MYNNTLVSIVIPVYNGEKYLAQAIDSALNQTYQNIEIIIINDGSTDSTEKIILSYGNKVTYYKKENGGVATALNLGIEKMKGEYFSWLSHDDLYCPEKIELQINEILKHPKNTIVYSDWGIFHDDPSNYFYFKSNHNNKNFRYWLTITQRLHGCTLLIPKSAFNEYGVFDVSLNTTQDYDLWFKIAKTYQFIRIPEVTVFARTHPEQGTIKLKTIAVKECDELLVSFTKNLSKEEVSNNNTISIKSGYIKIAENALYKNLMNTYNIAIKKGKVNKLDILFLYSKIKIKNIAIKIRPLFMNTIYKYLTKIKNMIKKILLKIIPNLRSQSGTNNQVDISQTPAVKKLENCNNLQDKFTLVYEHNLFEGKESRSGEGSNLVQTEVIRNKIPWLIKEYNIQSFLDAPCGDWCWMQHTDLSNLNKYIGIDIVSPLIDKNNKLFANSIVSFKAMNIAESELPQVDLILCRDCLVHLSYNDAVEIIKNFKSSGSKYLLTTTFTDRKENIDLGNTFWRTLNMQKPPFNFPKPIMLINENCTEGNNEFTDKCLGLWLLDDIKI